MKSVHLKERSVTDLSSFLQMGFEDLGLRFNYEINAKEARIDLMRSDNRPAESAVARCEDGTYGIVVRDRDKTLIKRLSKKYGEK